MKTSEQIINDIIMKSPWGHRLWEERQKRKYAKEKLINTNTIVIDKKNMRQIEFNFEEDINATR